MQGTPWRLISVAPECELEQLSTNRVGALECATFQGTDGKRYQQVGESWFVEEPEMMTSAV